MAECTEIQLLIFTTTFSSVSYCPELFDLWVLLGVHCFLRFPGLMVKVIANNRAWRTTSLACFFFFRVKMWSRTAIENLPFYIFTNIFRLKISQIWNSVFFIFQNIYKYGIDNIKALHKTFSTLIVIRGEVREVWELYSLEWEMQFIL